MAAGDARRWGRAEVMPVENGLSVLLDHLAFPEGPRWHDNRLWFSDMAGRTVTAVSLDGNSDIVARLDDRPSGLGFLPDRTPVVVSMAHKRLLRLVDGRAELHADLRDFPGDMLNDMVVDAEGRAYVGTRVASLRPWSTLPDRQDAPDSLVIVHPSGDAAIAADGLISPNGAVIAPDGRTLVIAETYAQQLVLYDRKPDGVLSNRRLFARVAGAYPDGICLDEEGAVWIGSPYSGEFARVRPGGEITDRFALAGAVACALGGEDRRRLFLLCVDPTALPTPDSQSERGPGWSGGLDRGSIWTTTVDCPGAGWP
jgi:sugar lactone lactonase YvrE